MIRGSAIPTPSEQLISWRYAIIQTGLFAAISITGLITDGVCAALAVYSLLSPMAALQALSLLVVFRSFNPGLEHYGALANVMYWALPLLVSLRLLPLANEHMLRYLVPVWLFCFVAALCSIPTSPALAVSLMKAATLALIVTGVLIANLRLTAFEAQILGVWLRSLAVVIAALSLAALVRPGIAHIPGSSLLRGVLNQSQALGAFLAPFTAAALSQWLLARRQATPLATATMGVLTACTLLTLSRTAAIATMLALLFSLIGGASGDGRNSSAAIGKAVTIGVTLALILSAVEIYSGAISRSLTHFILKGDTESVDVSVGEAFRSSRGDAIATQVRNFRTSPVLGHGFGVYADGVFPSGVTTIAGIPISAPVEKGFVPTAVLEETGVLGFLALGFLIYTLISSVWRRAPHYVVAMTFACLFVNFGEAVLLSPGGFGLHVWLLIGWCLRAAQLEVEPTAPAQPASTAPPRPYPNLLD